MKRLHAGPLLVALRRRVDPRRRASSGARD